ncbi:MAG: YkgJ family cysteine cluster protein [Labilithrix sp.]|nr:YkgJ family cysteine cluster protein [Labilithrix sp.]MCW5815498.1 YkgJ family cysteine cluster protein [Labilithrix sp.]
MAVAVTPKYRPIVRQFDVKHVKNAAAHVRAGGHAFVWEGKRRVTFVFGEPEDDNPDDFGLWGIYDMGKWRWKLETSGPLKGLATSQVPRDCFWIARRRAERDSIHEGTKRKIAIDCTECAACCRDNEVLLQPEDIDRMVKGGRPELTKAPYAKRHKDGRIILTLLPNKRCRHLQPSNMCGIYEIRPHSCSEFPMGSECCLFAREDILQLHDGLKPSEENS